MECIRECEDGYRLLFLMRKYREGSPYYRIDIMSTTGVLMISGAWQNDREGLYFYSSAPEEELYKGEYLIKLLRGEESPGKIKAVFARLKKKGIAHLLKLVVYALAFLVFVAPSLLGIMGYVSYTLYGGLSGIQASVIRGAQGIFADEILPEDFTVAQEEVELE